jgi:hypothetical protein
MAYADFTLQGVETAFGISTQVGLLFEDLAPLPVPTWLQELLARGLQLPLLSEKARGELIVMPILLACRELSGNVISIYSGARLDADPRQGLIGECDYILARTPPLPELRAPLIIILEAKKNDIESGLGQCAAQMVGARLWNERQGQTISSVYGCITTGEVWQFLRLANSVLTIDSTRYYLDSVGRILAAFQSSLPTTSQAA